MAHVAERPLVVADPGYEAPSSAARFMEAKVIAVPLRKDYSHECQGMAEAERQTQGDLHLNPNNPTARSRAKKH